MKNLYQLLFCVFAFTLLIVGCKKDRDNSPGSYIKHGDVVYELSQGILENYGKYGTSEANNLDVILLSPGFKIHESNGQIDSISGMGNGIHFEIHDSSFDKLDIDDYIYNNESEQLGTFNHSSAVFNYDSRSENPQEFEISSGKLTVKMNGSEYELSFDCLDSDGKIISGVYKGSLKYYNYDDALKSAGIKNWPDIR